jgi:hypothetical protein
MWGGFVFCAIWHAFSQLVLWVEVYREDSNEWKDRDVHFSFLLLMGMNIGLSGVSLCYFGMLAFK